MTTIGTDTFPLPRFIQEGPGIDLSQDGTSQALRISAGVRWADPMLVVMFGASNALGNELADTGEKTATAGWKVWDYDTEAFKAPVLGATPFRTATPPYEAPNNWGFQLCNQLAAEGRTVYLVLLAKASTDFPRWSLVSRGGTSGSTNNFDASQAAGTIPKVQDVMTAVLASPEISGANITKAHLVLMDLGGIDTLIGQPAIVERIENVVGSFRDQSWCGDETPFVAVDMPPRGSYGDVSAALNRYYTSGADPYFGLVNLEGISFTIDDYPADGDTAHYAGSSMTDVAARAIQMYYKLPTSALGNSRNPNAGNSVIIDAAGGAVPGQSISDPYEADCSTDGITYVLSSTGVDRDITYVRLVNDNLTRASKVTFHNYLDTDGPLMCLLPPLEAAVDIVELQVDGGFVVVTYNGNNPSGGDRVWITGVGGMTQVNNRVWDIVSLDTVNKQFTLRNLDDTTYPDASAWGAYTSGGTFASIIAFEDPRDSNLEAYEVYLSGRETFTYERQGSGDTSPLRATTSTLAIKPASEEIANDRMFNGQFKAGRSGWITYTRSKTTWAVGAKDSGRRDGERSMTLTDTSGLTNDLTSTKWVPVTPGEVLNVTAWVKSTVASPDLSTARLVLQYYDNSGATVGSPILAVNDTTIRASYTLTPPLVSVVPATATHAEIRFRANMTSGTLTVTDIRARIIGANEVCDGGAVGDGTANDTEALKAVFTGGVTAVLDKSKTYLLTERLSIATAGTGVLGNGALVKMSTASGHFDNATYSSRTGADAVAFYASGVDRVFVKDVRVTLSAWVDLLYLKAVYFNNCDDIEVSGCRFYGFSRGSGIVALDDCDRFVIRNNKFLDSYTNSTSGTAAEAQITGVEVDGNCSDGSKDGLIHGNTFRNLTMGSSAVTALGYQTDGVNLQGNKTKPTIRCRIEGNTFFNMGEGVDIFGDENIVVGNSFERCYNQGVKLIHGASDNLIADNIIKDVGRRGITVSGSMNADVGDSNGNVIRGNKIKGVGTSGDWANADGGLSSSGATTWNGVNTAGIHITLVQNSATYVPTNTTVQGNDIDCGTGGVFGIYGGDFTGGDGNNRVFGNVVRNSLSGSYQDTNSDLIIENGRPLAVAADFTHSADVSCYLVGKSSACVVNLLPPEDFPGMEVTFTNTTAQTLDSTLSEVIPRAGGAAATSILPATDGAWATLRSNGTSWYIIRSSG